MLKRRIATAAVLGPLVVLAVVALPTPWLGLLLAVPLLLAAWEWGRLAGWLSSPGRAGYLMLVSLALVAVAVPAVSRHGPGTLDDVTAGVALVWWAVALGWVAAYRGRAARWPAGARPAFAAAGLLALVPAWYALLRLHADPAHGVGWVLMLLVLVWAADIAAFFAGRAWGRRRLAPHVSPGKTLEGAAAGVAAGAVLAPLGALALGVPAGVGLAVLFGATVVASIVGDLFESLMKREAGEKDSGRLLPGHGGMLDRIDSLTAAAPVFWAGLRWLGMTQ